MRLPDTGDLFIQNGTLREVMYTEAKDYRKNLVSSIVAFMEYQPDGEPNGTPKMAVRRDWARFQRHADFVGKVTRRVRDPLKPVQLTA